jgi:hypothetical protein
MKPYTYQKWADADSNTAVIMWWHGARTQEIAAALDRTHGSVRRHLNAIRYGRGSVTSEVKIVPLEIPPEVDVDRDRSARLWHHDLTSALCGDPLPGYSALERRA